MKVNLSNLFTVLAAQRQTAQPPASRKKAAVAPEPPFHPSTPANAKK